MRQLALVLAAVVLLGAPTVIAFFSGGYFAEPRLVAALAVWTGVLLLCLAGPAPLPRGRAGRIALGGLALVVLWTAASFAWSPLDGVTQGSVQRLLLYLGAFVLALGVARVPRALRAFEPALATGALVVVGHGLSERVLPGLVKLDRSPRSNGRLEQPITYWNGLGALAALGLVLCARIVGDRSRPGWMRAAAAAASAPLGAGIWLSYSRGAIAVAVVGVLVLVALVPRTTQLRGSLIVLVAGILAGAAAGLVPSASSLEGRLSVRAQDGLILLVALALVAFVAAAASLRLGRARPLADRALPGGRRLVALAATLVVVAVGGLVVGGLGEKGSGTEVAATGAERLASVQTNRYEYWRVGLEAFADRPLTGLGAGGFRVRWLQERRIPEAVLEVHSLPLEMAVELGLVGVLAFLAWIGGVGASARQALRRRPALAAGPCAAALAWLLHATIDWDWQLPAVSLPAVILAGALLVLAEREPGEELTPGTSASATRPRDAAAAAPPPRAS